jgi:peptidoglycan/xylan/chitin deacetylase (PgdA/CDA1 family)
MNKDGMLDVLRGDRSIFNIFTREEEYRNGLRDSYGRFPYYASEERSIREPVVSRYLNQHGMQVRYPDGHKFAVCLSHDVDVLCPHNYFRKELDSIRSFTVGDFRGTIDILRRPRVVRPFLDSREIMALEEKYGARSSFYFIAVDGGPDRSYDINEIKDDLKFIDGSGWEVGLHGSQAAHADLERMKKEKALLEGALGKGVVGYRNHFLRFKVPLTWRLLQQAGFKYDTTLGYADCAGFRGGMCHPFFPYDLEAGTTIDILEIPLVIMDASLFQNYMRLDIHGAWDLIKGLIDVVESQRGTIGILWHNTNMLGDTLRLYEKTLQYCSDRNAWMPTGKQLQQEISIEI